MPGSAFRKDAAVKKSIMAACGETPVTPLHLPGNHFYVKRDDLLPFSLGGNKVRIAAAFLEDMEAKGADCLIMYGNSRSNLCRVLVSACHQENIPCMMICSDDPDGARRVTANSRLVELFGTEILYCAKNAIAPAVDEAFRRAKERGYVPYYIYGNRLGEGNEGVAARAYAKAYGEICREEARTGRTFDYIFHASGTGSTQSGLIAGHLLAGDRRRIVGISVSRDRERGTRILTEGVRAFFEDAGKALPEHFGEAICLEDAYLAGGYGQYDDRIRKTIRRMFLEESLPLDPTYTGKAFAGMLDYLEKHEIRDANILFLHTGGTPLFYDYLLSEGL